MDGIYLLLVKTTLVAAIVLAAVTSWTAITLETKALLPMIGLGVTAAFYARWQMSRTRELSRSPSRG